jgi:hypothetical protein
MLLWSASTGSSAWKIYRPIAFFPLSTPTPLQPAQIIDASRAIALPAPLKLDAAAARADSSTPRARQAVFIVFEHRIDERFDALEKRHCRRASRSPGTPAEIIGLPLLTSIGSTSCDSAAPISAQHSFYREREHRAFGPPTA